MQRRDVVRSTVYYRPVCLTLTGSERISKSEATGDRLKEAQHINKSLSALGDVMAALGAKKPHIPYRNSKLTTVLQDSLGASHSRRVDSHRRLCPRTFRCL